MQHAIVLISSGRIHRSPRVAPAVTYEKHEQVASCDWTLEKPCERRRSESDSALKSWQVRCFRDISREEELFGNH